jgi:hypothetical protein
LRIFLVLGRSNSLNFFKHYPVLGKTITRVLRRIGRWGYSSTANIAWIRFCEMERDNIIIRPLLFSFFILFAPPFSAGHSETTSSPEPSEKLTLRLRIHLTTDLSMTKKGVNMSSWITPKMIEEKVLPEVNRIWSQANVEWILDGIQDCPINDTHRDEVISYVLATKRDSEGHGDPERIQKYLSILPIDREEERVVNIYAVPYLGGTSQGNACKGARILIGEWTDKPSGGNLPPQKCLLVEPEPFAKGSFGRTMAHELGHILGLSHPKERATPQLMGSGGYILTEEQKDTARKKAYKITVKQK